MLPLVDKMRNRKRWILVAVAIGFIVFALGAWIGLKVLDEAIRIPPDGLTQTTMIVIKRRIFMYIGQHGEIPKNLEQLPSLPGYYNSIEDAWGHPILYSVNESGVVTLKSFRPSKKLGKTNEAECIIETFPTKDSNGNWLQ